MPDFAKIVRERMAALRLEPASDARITEEVTRHLEDLYRELRSGGATEGAAYRQTMAELDHLPAMPGDLSARHRTPRVDAVPAGDSSRSHWIGDCARDLRYAARIMRKNPFFVLFAVLTLGLGIGANTTVFTLINTFLLNPLPVPDSSGLFAVSTAETKSHANSPATLPMSYPNLKDCQAKNEVFRSLAGYTYPQVVSRQVPGGSERMFSELVTGNYFSTLGIVPARGRFFSPQEDGAPGAHPVAVMNYATWQTRFGGTEDIIGQKLRLNGSVFMIIGVAPARFIGVNAIFGPDLWIPAAMAETLLPGEMRDVLSDRSKTAFMGVGRLKPGIRMARAQADLTTIGASLASEYPQFNEGHTISVRPVTEVIFGSDGSSTGRTPILFGSAVLFAVVAIVLLIACSNVANLLLARSAARGQEIAIRLAMGASRARLFRQLLTESVLLALAGGMAGLAIGAEGSGLLWSFRPAEVAANLVTPKLDGNVFIFALIISILTGVIFGTLPAWRASRTSVSDALKEESRTTGRSRRKITFANALLIGQVAFSFVSLAAAALFLRSIQRAYEIDPGFDTQHLAVLMTNPMQAGYGKPQTQEFYKETRERVMAMPGVESVSWASNLPLWGRIVSGLRVEGWQPQSKADTITSVLNTVDVDYFKTMGIRIVRGRDFSALDREDSTPVAIVNQKLAHDRWPDEEALGKRLQLPGETAMRQVIGVAWTADYSNLAEPPQPCVYVPLTQSFSGAMVFYVRSKADPQQILLPVQREIHTIAPQIAAADVRTGRKIVDQALFGAKIGVTLLSVFGLLALGLASVGLYGILAYSVNLRRREIGVRMAMGAAQSGVLGLIVKQGMTLVLAGVMTGLIGALVVGRLLTRMLYGVSAADPVSMIAAACVLVAVALLACYLPARAASRLDPLAALREG